YNPPTSTPPTIMCPAPSATSLNGQAVAVTFSPTVSGGTAPVSTICVPASGSLFPVGSTALNCSAVDAKSLTASCSSSVSVTSSVAPPPPATTITLFSISCPLIAPVVSHSGNPVKVDFSPTTTGGAAP